MSDKKLVEQITYREVDFSKWYTDVVKKAELVDYASVRGCMILRPYGYAIWENIQKKLDAEFKKTGHQNVYMPMFIPESSLQKEKDHIEGFAPEVAWVTKGGDETLSEPICVRPTSEVLFCEHYADIIKSYRDLPKLYNQWCSVVRWEKTTRPFLRSLEFLWQEGHTAHKDQAEALEETKRMLDVYSDFCCDVLAIPVIKGQKTEKEKFAGAISTFTIEALMHDGKALQAGTSHYFGDNFAKALNIKYLDRDNQLKYVHQTSWGMSTRIIGAIIMVHGDNQGLVLPPLIAPTQIAVVPVAQHKSGVLETCRKICSELKSHFSVHLDDSDKMPGWKFSEYEMKGVPLRIEIGPRDIESCKVTAVRRDNNERLVISTSNLVESIQNILSDIQQNLLDSAARRRENCTHVAKNMDDIIYLADNSPGFIKAMWCGRTECEEKIKEKTSVTSRCIPENQEILSDKCVCCGLPAKHMLYWGRAY